MLYIVTGDVQCGKTHWLTGLVNELAEKGAHYCGVLAPGKWDHDGKKFVKRGFNNLLLPSLEVVEIAIRADFKDDKCQKFFNPYNTKKWLFDDDGINRVNTHFKYIYDEVMQKKNFDKYSGLIYVVDELGPIELENNSGITWAIKLLQDLPSVYASSEPTAFVVVRNSLVKTAKSKLNMWKEQTVIDCNCNTTDITKKILSTV